jgi:hypothetical protein
MRSVPEGQDVRRFPVEPQRLRVVVDLRVPVRRLGRHQHRLTGADRAAGQLDILQRHPGQAGVGAARDDPEHLLDGCRNPVRAGQQVIPSGPVGEQRDHHVADHVEGGLVPGDQQGDAEHVQLGLGQPGAVGVAGRDQRAEQVVARPGRSPAPLVDEFGHVRGDRLHRGHPRLGGHRRVGDNGLDAGTEDRPALQRDAHQLADHGDRQRLAQGLDQVGGAARANHLGDQPLRGVLDERPEALDPPGGERGRDEAAEPAVLGLVEVGDVGGHLG